MRILMLEQNREFTQIVRELLEKEGYDVDILQESPLVPDYLKHENCDLMILNAALPDNGCQPVRRAGTQLNELCFGDTTLLLSSATLQCGQQKIRLTAKEFQIMRLLMQNPNHNLSKELILSYVWGYETNATENHVEVYIGFLRKKLAQIGSCIRIVSIRKLGYHLMCEASGSEPQRI